MPLASLAPGFAATLKHLCEFIARFGLARGLAGPLIIHIWQRVRTAGVQVESLLARLRAGTLRRHDRRRPAVPRATPRRPPNREKNPPRKRGWLVGLIPETAGCAGQLHYLLAHPDFPALLAAAPQLRRRLRPLCHMLGVTLPRPPTPTPPAPDLPPDLPPEPPPEPPPGAPMPAPPHHADAVVARLRPRRRAAANSRAGPRYAAASSPSRCRHPVSIASASRRRPMSSECFSRTRVIPASDSRRHKSASR